MGQLLLAGEAAFATWTMARYLSYNGSVLSSSRSQPARWARTWRGASGRRGRAVGGAQLHRAAGLTA